MEHGQVRQSLPTHGQVRLARTVRCPWEQLPWGPVPGDWAGGADHPEPELRETSRKGGEKATTNDPGWQERGSLGQVAGPWPC